MKIFEFENSKESDEMAYDEPSQLISSGSTLISL